MTTREERIAGGLLGVHTGDSLGATLEFQDAKSIRKTYGVHREITGGGPFGWRAGDATDDTDLTRAVGLAYWNTYSSPNSDQVVHEAAERFLDWYDSVPKDVGGATARGIGHYKTTGNVRAPTYKPEPRSHGPLAERWAELGWGDWVVSSIAAAQPDQGNGSLMRCIPTGLARANDPERRRYESEAISAITHPDPVCTEACVAYNDIVARLVEGDDAFTALNKAGQSPNDEVEGAIAYGMTWRLNGPPPQWDGESAYHWKGGRGWVLDSLALAVAAMCSGLSFERALIRVVNMGGDADTNGAIAGGLLGTLYGVKAIPRRWRKKLQYRRAFEAIAEDLAGVVEA